MRLLVAAHSRDVKKAVFVGLSGIEHITIVGAAATTAELLSLSTALAPDLVVVEAGLPGEPLGHLLTSIEELSLKCRVLILDPHRRHDDEIASWGVQAFGDIEDLVTAAVPDRR
jgi:DNA-binding NarL/FixJ family response regulator